MKLSEKLKIIVFVSGTSIMILEVLGSRLIAPYFGTSTYVWSAIIGVVLTSLSVGYYWGGRLADNDPSEKKLSKILYKAAIFVFYTIFIKDIILPFTYLLGVKFGAFIAPLILLAPVGFYLGVVSPYAIKLSAKKLGELGSITGELYALSTLGSILGTFACGFILIPYLSFNFILSVISLSLLGASVLLNYENKRDYIPLTLVVVIMLVLYNPPKFSTREVLHYENTPYNEIRVEQDDEIRYLFLDRRSTGAIVLDSGYSKYDYINYFELPFLVNPDIEYVLMAGEGTGVGARFLRENHPSVKVTVAEIDPRVHEIAVKYFSLEEDDNLDVIIGDVRMLTPTKKVKYDYVILDAYNSRYTIPHHLVTTDFFKEIKAGLNPDGIVLLNVISAVEGPNARILKSIVKTLNQEFNSIIIYALNENLTSLQNVIILASESHIPGRKILLDNVRDTQILNQTQIRTMIESQVDPPYTVDNAIILTDDYSPIDNLYLSIILG